MYLKKLSYASRTPKNSSSKFISQPVIFELTWWMFALPGALALMVTLLTVSSQAFKAARLNPVESLRCE